MMLLNISTQLKALMNDLILTVLPILLAVVAGIIGLAICIAVVYFIIVLIYNHIYGSKRTHYDSE